MPNNVPDLPRFLPPISAGPMWSADFAVALGLQRSTIPDYDYPRNELERLNRIIWLKEYNERFTEGQREVIFSRFCALYLPATVEKFLNPPPTPEASQEIQRELLINNAYFSMLADVQHTPYFFKYLRSTKPAAANNRIITKAFAERILAIAPLWDTYFETNPPDRPYNYFNDTAGAMLQLLATFLMTFVKDEDQEAIVPSDIRRRLIPYLKKWLIKYRTDFLGEVAGRNLGILSRDEMFAKGVRWVRKRMRGWDECGMDGCKNSENLKACSRCQTVRYCSPAHQKAHWSIPGDGHKEHCHKTEY